MAKKQNTERNVLLRVNEAYKRGDHITTAGIQDTLNVVPIIDFMDEYDGDFGKNTTLKILKSIRELYTNKKRHKGDKEKLDEITSKIKKIEDVLGLTPLPDEMYDAINKLGDIPLDEPELYKEGEEIKEEEYYALVEKRTNIKIDEYDQLIYDRFVAEVINKISNTRDEDGNLKRTPLAEKFGIPTREEIKEISKTALDIVASDDIPDIEKNQAIQDGVVDILVKTRGDFVKNATKWEQKHLVELVNEYINKKTTNFLKAF